MKSLEEYLLLDTHQSVKDLVSEFLKSELTNEIPICILSYKFHKSRSKFLVDIVKQQDIELIDREIYVFVYDDEEELYSFLKKYPNVHMVYITPNSTNNTLTGKRNYVVDYAKTMGWSNIFIIEDDTSNYWLPIRQYKNGKFYKNTKHSLSINEAFYFWEWLIKTNNLLYSSPLIESGFIWSNLSKYNFKQLLRKNCTCIQAIHVNIDFLKSKDIMYDPNSGWDDFDMNLQIVINGGFTTLIPMGYHTIRLKSGNSTIDKNLDERCTISSTKFVNKWGKDLTRIQVKRGVTNARIRWVKLKNILEKHGLKKLRSFIPGKQQENPFIS